MAYAILRTRKLKSWAALGATARHNDRRSAPANADPSRGIRMLVGTGDIEAEARARLLAAGIDPARLRKDGVLAVEAIITASPAYFRPGREGAAGTWDADRLDAWLAATRQFIEAEWGDRVVSVALHLDEATVHQHVTWLPIDDTPRKRGPAVRLNAGRWLDGRAKLAGLQDRYAAAMTGLGLERGARGARIHHKKIARMYGAMQVDADAAALARLQAQGLLDQAEAIYRQAAELLPSLARTALMAPIRSLGALLRGPVAGPGRQNQVVRER